MDKIKNCIACNKKLDEDKYEKNRTICKNCYNKKKRKYNKNSEKVSVIDEHIFNRTNLVGPSFSGTILLMLKILSRICDRDNYIVAKDLLNSIQIRKSKLMKLVRKQNL